MTPIDTLVDNYLGAVAWAARDLSPQCRDDLLADLREHIATARTDLDPETEAGVRTILDRLGDPVSIAAEARRDESPDPASPPPAAAAVPAARRSRPAVWLGIAVAAVLGLVLITCAAAVLGLAAFTTSDVEQHPAPAPIPTSRSRTG